MFFLKVDGARFVYIARIHTLQTTHYNTLLIEKDIKLSRTTSLG